MGNRATICCGFMLVLGCMHLSVEGSKEFKVGDELCWVEPSPNSTATYTLWASTHRFHVGDSLSFEYKNDSVLEVEKWDYYHCNTSNPIIAFNNGKSVIKLDRPGPFYFISGAPDHCKNGQRLLVDVMGPHQSPPSIADPPESDQLAPSPFSSSGMEVSLRISALSLAFFAMFFTLVNFSCV